MHVGFGNQALDAGIMQGHDEAPQESQETSTAQHQIHEQSRRPARVVAGTVGEPTPPDGVVQTFDQKQAKNKPVCMCVSDAERESVKKRVRRTEE